jgi:hypothetical protein
LQSNGASAPTWANVSGSISITDDTTTNATRYLTFTSVTSGSITTEYTSSTKLQFNPSTGVLTATSFNGTATNATNIAVTDNTSTNANYYPVFVSSNSGNNAATTSSTKLKYNPSTGALYVSAIYIAP